MIRFVSLACGLSLVTTAVLPACSSSDGSGNTGTTSSFASGLPADKAFSTVTDADIGTMCEAWARYVIGPQRDTFCRTEVWAAATAKVGEVDTIGCFSQGQCPGGAVEPPSGDLRCTAQCSDATGPICSYECTGSTPADLDTNCANAKAAACGATDADVQKACSDAQTACAAPVPVADVAAHCRFQKPASACTGSVGEFEACVAESFVIMRESYSDFSSCSSLTVADVKQLVGRTPGAPAENHTACKTFSDKCPGVFGETVVSPDCGNGVVDPGEQCDGTNLDGETCASVTGGNLPNGELVCNRACMFDGSVCTGP